MNLSSKLAIITAILLAGGIFSQGCTAKRSIYSYSAPCEEVEQKPVVAVLMFQNLSAWDGADKIIETLFTSELIKEGYTVVEPADIKKMYLAAKASDKETATTRIIDLLAAQFDVKYFITGSVVNYGYIKNRKKAVPLVSFNVRMLDWNKEIVWKAYMENKGTDSEIAFTLGEIRTPDRLAGLNIRRLVSKFCFSKLHRS